MGAWATVGSPSVLRKCKKRRSSFWSDFSAARRRFRSHDAALRLGLAPAQGFPGLNTPVLHPQLRHQTLRWEFR